MDNLLSLQWQEGIEKVFDLKNERNCLRIRLLIPQFGKVIPVR